MKSEPQVPDKIFKRHVNDIFFSLRIKMKSPNLLSPQDRGWGTCSFFCHKANLFVSLSFFFLLFHTCTLVLVSPSFYIHQSIPQEWQQTNQSHQMANHAASLFTLDFRNIFFLLLFYLNMLYKAVTCVIPQPTVFRLFCASRYLFSSYFHHIFIPNQSLKIMYTP